MRVPWGLVFADLVVAGSAGSVLDHQDRATFLATADEGQPATP